MAVELFEHNRTACEAAFAMLQREGRAAVIHPTGTGKSFIGFALAEKYAGGSVLWLSPSEYIFRTQLEAVRSACGSAPGNITFRTYARLMHSTDAEMRNLAPDLIVLDEFHRAGAAEWGRSVKRLIAMFPAVPFVGLSATSIRYLDSRRDMAEELFGGCVASEMTLGEAIVRGILRPPVYVTALYSCSKELGKYERRVRRAKNPAARNAAEKYLDALRRALDKADGLDVVFDRRMTDRRGRYIVFCSDARHMDEMISRAGEMFGKVDPSPRIYRVYSDDPVSAKSFAAFKSDDSDHLKLLYAIDMLNEGVHVSGVSGVILFRPTVSPIVYKQQIGRALSASGGAPVIFDIVDNFENLYSVGAIESEMEHAIGYYRMTGENAFVINERFTVIDEVRECRRLFDALEDTLSASWDEMFAVARAYAEEHGNLAVPKRYRTPDGLPLGSWINTQRAVRSGCRRGVLTDSQIKRLTAIGMIWDSRSDIAFARGYAEARRYKAERGDLDVPVSYRTKSGFALGVWVANLRQKRAGNITVGTLTPERISMLDELGMIWDKSGSLWERNMRAAEKYYEACGNLAVPSGYRTDDGVQLGSWLRSLRARQKSLTDEQRMRLDKIGMSWENAGDKAWSEKYALAAKYYSEHGNLDIPVGYKTDGVALGKWLSVQRYRAARGSLSVAKLGRLKEIGFAPKADAWETRYALAEEYYRRYGNLRPPQHYGVGGVDLEKWISVQRVSYRNGTLSDERKARLDEIGMEWVPSGKKTNGGGSESTGNGRAVRS